VPARTKLTDVATVQEAGSWTFTIRDRYGEDDEVILVPCDANDADADDVDAAGVRAWINRCTHEAQRFDTGRGVPIRDGALICPKHGSMFDACSGHCDNGEAADTTLPDVDIEIEDGDVYLTDGQVTFKHAGKIDEGDDSGPSSTSHIGL